MYLHYHKYFQHLNPEKCVISASELVRVIVSHVSGAHIHVTLADGGEHISHDSTLCHQAMA